MSCRSRLVQSLAELIHWSDKTLLHTKKVGETTAIKATIGEFFVTYQHTLSIMLSGLDVVKSAVADLVEESIKKIQIQTHQSAPVTPMKALKSVIICLLYCLML